MNRFSTIMNRIQELTNRENDSLIRTRPSAPLRNHNKALA